MFFLERQPRENYSFLSVSKIKHRGVQESFTATRRRGKKHSSLKDNPEKIADLYFEK
jgi:hypothetical protein